MLKYKLLHPQILEALASSGHGSQVLIADSNYPFNTGANNTATRVYLNLALGLVSLLDVLNVLTDAIPIESAQAIHPGTDEDPPIYEAYRQILPDVSLSRLERFAFYDAAKSNDTSLVIATGEQRTWACILLTIGVFVAE